MKKIIEKLMRKIIGVPENITCLQFKAESMEEAEKIRDRLIYAGILPHENFSVWTGDGKIFTAEESKPIRTLGKVITAFPNDIFDDDDLYAEVPEGFFDVNPHDLDIIPDFDWFPEDEEIII